MKERAYPVYTVNKHAEGLLVGGHPWVYENDILHSPENEPENGTLADVVSTKGSYLGTGFVSLKSKIDVYKRQHLNAVERTCHHRKAEELVKEQRDQINEMCIRDRS